MKYELDFYTSYNQFYLFDKTSGGNTASDNFWTADAYNDRLALEAGILGVSTACYGHVKGELYILSQENEVINSNQYDHIVEGGLELKSGILQVLDCPNSEIELEVELKPGTYHVRVYSSDLASAEIDETEGNDYY
jgi:hypothetical protein